MENKEKIYNAIILQQPWAMQVYDGSKKIETRMRGLSQIMKGDLIIVMAKSEEHPWAGYGVCMVNVFDYTNYMRPEWENDCKISYFRGRHCYFLDNWRYFSEDFIASKYRVGGSFQSIFQIKLPPTIELIPQPQIKPILRTIQSSLFSDCFNQNGI